MKFDKSQLDAHNFISHGNDKLIHATKLKPCCSCGEKCEWLSISFGSFFCSGDCLDKHWKDFFEELGGQDGSQPITGFRHFVQVGDDEIDVTTFSD